MEKQPFCYKCGTPCTVGKDFCPTCGIPITMTATAAPYERVLALGYAYGEATNRPHKPIILLGMLVLWLPQLIGCIFLARVCVTEFLHDPRWSELPYGLFLFAVLGGYGYICWRMVAKTTGNYFRLRREKASEAPAELEA